MALITCGDCGKDVSDKAPACPHCGAPLSRAIEAGGQPVLTTQQTAKKYKGAQLVGCAMLVAGLVVGCSSAQSTGGGLLGAAGLLVYLGARLLAWWEHG